MVWNGTVPIRVHQTSKTEADAQARVGNPPEEAEVERLKQKVDDLEDKRRFDLEKLWRISQNFSRREVGLLEAVKAEKARADHLEGLLGDIDKGFDGLTEKAGGDLCASAHGETKLPGPLTR
ncbi:unnamed protein product [Ascophyllum nodosum]